MTMPIMPTKIRISDSGSGCHGGCGRSPTVSASPNLLAPRAASRRARAEARPARAPAALVAARAAPLAASAGVVAPAPRRFRRRACLGALRFATALRPRPTLAAPHRRRS